MPLELERKRANNVTLIIFCNGDDGGFGMGNELRRDDGGEAVVFVGSEDAVVHRRKYLNTPIFLGCAVASTVIVGVLIVPAGVKEWVCVAEPTATVETTKSLSTVVVAEGAPVVPPVPVNVRAEEVAPGATAALMVPLYAAIDL